MNVQRADSNERAACVSRPTLTLAANISGFTTKWTPYDNVLWTNNATFATDANLEFKGAAYMSAFRSFRVDFIVGGVQRCINFNVAMPQGGLAAMFSATREFPVGYRAAWEQMFTSPGVQPYCNAEKVNFFSHRLGITMNQENDW